jgi:hypothetical protein
MGAWYADQDDTHDKVFQVQVYYMMGLSEITPQSLCDLVDDARVWMV